MNWKIIALLAAFTACLAEAQKVAPELLAETQTAIVKGLEWLKNQQKPDGHWSDEAAPALTALPLWAICASGKSEYDGASGKAIAWLLGRQQPDGGIYTPVEGRPGGGLGTYNTALCLAALHATGRRELAPAVLKARDYLAASQLAGADQHTGGFGYDKNASRRYSDLNNTVFSIDAMRRSQSAEEFRPAGERRADLNWEAALAYVSRMQAADGDDAGGFAYTLQSPRGDMATNAAGRVILHTYGSISYAGLLALVHAELDKSDPRVRSVVDYSARHWTLEENPGQGQQGLYFYYNIMARALSASGLDAIPKKDRDDEILWRTETVRKVLALQRPDGSWVNANNRWWENDPNLVTAYALLALEFAVGLTR